MGWGFPFGRTNHEGEAAQGGESTKGHCVVHFQTVVLCHMNFTSIKNTRKLWLKYPNIWKVNSVHQNNYEPENKSKAKVFLN